MRFKSRELFFVGEKITHTVHEQKSKHGTLIQLSLNECFVRIPFYDDVISMYHTYFYNTTCILRFFHV